MGTLKDFLRILDIIRYFQVSQCVHHWRPFATLFIQFLVAEIAGATLEPVKGHSKDIPKFIYSILSR